MSARLIARKLAAPAACVAVMVTGPGPARSQVMDQARYLFLRADNLEQAPSLPGRPLRLEGDVWYGGDWNRVWIKLDGDLALSGDTEGELEAQALYTRVVSPYWDLQVGLRVDRAWGNGGRSRGHAVVGIQGLAPYWFEVESAVFLSDGGDLSAELQASYELLFTQRLILEPEVQLQVSATDQPEWGTGSGLTRTEMAWRLRYEFRREFAPYLGWVWARSWSGTADLARATGQPPSRGSLVAGVRMWY